MDTEDKARVAVKPEKTVVIMRSWPGCGKSTLAKRFCMEWVDAHGILSTWLPTYKICSADDYHMINGKYQWKAENVKRAHGFCKAAFTSATWIGTTLIIVDNTNIKPKHYKFYVDVARKEGYKVFQSIPACPWKNDVDECFKRNVHNVPLETIKSMMKDFEVDDSLEHFSIPRVSEDTSFIASDHYGSRTKPAGKFRFWGKRA